MNFVQMSDSRVSHLAGPEGALHVHPGVADGRHAHQQQWAQRAIGDALGRARELALRQ